MAEYTQATLTYEITGDDFNEYQQEIMKRLKSEAKGGGKRGETFFLNFVFGLAIAGLAFATSRYTSLDGISILVGAVAMILSRLPLTLHSQRRLAYMTRPRQDGVVLGPRTLVIDDSTLSVENQNYKTQISWDGVFEVFETKNLYILRMDTIVGEIIPKRSLESSPAPETVRDLLLNRGAV